MASYTFYIADSFREWFNFLHVAGYLASPRPVYMEQKEDVG